MVGGSAAGVELVRGGGDAMAAAVLADLARRKVPGPSAQ